MLFGGMLCSPRLKCHYINFFQNLVLIKGIKGILIKGAYHLSDVIWMNVHLPKIQKSLYNMLFSEQHIASYNTVDHLANVIRMNVLWWNVM